MSCYKDSNYIMSCYKVKNDKGFKPKQFEKSNAVTKRPTDSYENTK